MQVDSTQIYIDSINKLVGAPEVKTRVLHALALGYPSYESHAHLVKCRVKDLESLVKKIKDRRSDSKRPSYCANDVTDIVGLRLLALYRKDLPSLCSQFLRFIEAGQKDEFFLFVGETMAEACTEIILYTSAEPDDADDNAILNVFEERGIQSVMPNGAGGEGTETSLKVVVKRKKSGYSSLHIIVWCKNPLKPEPEFSIPMEVQIRTSLEDVWGEIDHALNYKKSENEEDDTVKFIKKNAQEHLRNLKGQLDVCGKSADSIARQIAFSDFSSGPDGPQRPALTINLETLSELPIPSEARERIAPLVGELKEALQEFREARFAGDYDRSIALSKKFEKCADGFIHVYDSIQGVAGFSPGEKKKSSYYLLMEAALCFYWSGNIYELIQNTIGEVDGLLAQPVDFYQKSLTLYSKIQRLYKQEGDAIIAYRMATVFSALGDEVIAKESYQESAENLLKYEQDNLPSDHYLRVRIPRQFGMALWEEAENYRIRGLDMDDPGFRKTQRRRLYVEALKVTLPLLDVVVGTPKESPDVRPDDERLMTANNVVDYALCILRVGGTIEDLANLGLSRERLDELADLFLPEGGVSNMDVPIWLDTLRAFRSQLLMDEKGAKEAAHRVIEVIEDNRDLAVLKYGERFVEEMLADAHYELDINS